METDIYRLRIAAITGEEFEARLDRAWLKLQADPSMANQVSRDGIDISTLLGRRRDEFIDVKLGSRAGLTGLETVVVNVIAGITIELFRSVLLPAITKGLNREDVVLESESSVSR